MDTLKRLDDWWNGAKGRFVEISQGTTYGATSWECILGNCDERKRVITTEVFFFTKKDGTVPYHQKEDNGWDLYVAAVASDKKWCGSEKVINLALDIAEKEGI